MIKIEKRTRLIGDAMEALAKLNQLYGEMGGVIRDHLHLGRWWSCDINSVSPLDKIMVSGHSLSDIFSVTEGI